jgi:hypothetical protein
MKTATELTPALEELYREISAGLQFQEALVRVLHAHPEVSRKEVMDANDRRCRFLES